MSQSMQGAAAAASLSPMSRQHVGWSMNGPPGEPEHPQQDPAPQRPRDPVDPGRPQQPELPPVDPHTPTLPEPHMRAPTALH